MEGDVELLLLTSDPDPEAVLPSLSLLAHTVRPAPTEVSSLLEGLDDVLLPTTGPAELDARLRLLVGRRGGVASQESSGKITLGELIIDEGTYTARLRGRPLDLTYKEFELLKYLAQHAGRVFTRAQLLQEVWGYDFFGGTRTVDVHVRRLRAKLGSEYESLIGTVRNVGYKAVRPTRGAGKAGPLTPPDDDSDDVDADGPELAPANTTVF
jgi:DNA-binding response OmpR family regulator